MFKSLLSALALLVLAGCATPQATIAPSATASVQRHAEEGAVALRLTVSAPDVGTFFEFWTTLTVASVEPGKTDQRYDVGLSKLGAVGSASYFGALPPGKYRIAVMSSQSCGMACLTSSANFGEKGPTFEVSKGQITYLGNAIYLRDGKRSGLFFHPAGDHENFRTWLKTYYPAWAAVPLRDTARPSSDLPARLYASVQDITMGYLNGIATPNGTVLFNNYAGSLYKVSWPAAVSVVNTGLLSRGNTVLPLSDTHWLIGGDFGEVRETRDAGASWHDAGLSLPYGGVRGLYRGKGDELLAVLEQETKLELYSGRAGGPWSLVASVPFSANFWQGGIRRPSIIPSDDRKRLMFAIPSGTSFVLDTTTYARTEFEFPGGAMNVGLSGDNVLRCRCNRSGLWVSTWESRDDGRHWQDSELKRSMPLPHFIDKSTGYGTNGFNLARTLDGGKTWTDIFVQKQRPYWPFLLLPYEMRYIVAGGQRMLATDTLDVLLASEDNGASWQPVHVK